MSAISIFELVLSVIQEAPILIADIGAVVSAIKAFGAANPTPTKEATSAAVIAAAKASV